MTINSLLDLDYYKLTMAQVAWRHFRDVPVTYGLTNRTRKVALASAVSEDRLRQELEAARRLRFLAEETAYLAGLKIFDPAFLAFLRTVELPPFDLSVENGQFRLEVSGPWPHAIFWETLILSIINELFYESQATSGCPEGGAGARREGLVRLQRKIERLNRRPDIRFIEFGTRRRFSREWQEKIVTELRDGLSGQLVGTSNVNLARRLGIKPVGTFAHEMDMVFSGIFHADDDDIRASHSRVLQYWWAEYGEPLSIALTDTYGSDFFFRDFTPEQARLWRGLRQDSGDPFVFGEQAIKFYERLGIDPRTKTIVWSDGLDIDAVEALQSRFAGRVGVLFGWGTNLTNDCGFPSLSLVVKVTRANGHPTVKLSDNIAKAMGPTEEIERFKRIFGYRGGINQECVY